MSNSSIWRNPDNNTQQNHYTDNGDKKSRIRTRDAESVSYKANHYPTNNSSSEFLDYFICNSAASPFNKVSQVPMQE